MIQGLVRLWLLLILFAARTTAFVQFRPIRVSLLTRQPYQKHHETLQWTQKVGQGSIYEECPIVDDPDIRALQESLAAVRQLPRISPTVGFEDPLLALAVQEPRLPTFRRLFTHKMWRYHTGGMLHRRWWFCLRWTHKSEILRSVFKTVLGITAYSTLAGYLIRKISWFHQIVDSQQLPLSLTANAISLLLVFRTNNAYRRLEEARELWNQVIYLSREIVATVATTACYQSYKTPAQRSKHQNCMSTKTVVQVSRYLAAFAWSLRDELRDGDEREDILKLLLYGPEEEWVARQRSRPLAIHGRLRRLLFTEKMAGRLEPNMHFLMEGDLRKLALVVSSIERIFTSPIPPAMSRHGTRSVILFFFVLPLVFGMTCPLAVIAAWSCILSFLFLGIEELGAQVEQPFTVMPLWQLCTQLQVDIEELVLHPLNVSTEQLDDGCDDEEDEEEEENETEAEQEEILSTSDEDQMESPDQQGKEFLITNEAYLESG